MSITKGFVILAFAISIGKDKFVICNSGLCRQIQPYDYYSLFLYPNAIDKNNITANQISSNMTSTSNVHPLAARIQLIFFLTDYTPEYIFTTHYVAWARVAISGGTSSRPIMYKQSREQKGLLLLRVSSLCFDLIKLY